MRFARAAIHGAILVISAWGSPGLADSNTSLLGEALERRYGCGVQARLRLVSHGRGGESRLREVESVSKRIRGRTHALARVLKPYHLRGMTILAIERSGRGDDVFVHLPALGRTRRVLEARRSESFLGTDLSWADLERHRLEDYEIVEAHETSHETAAALRLETRLREPGSRHRVDFVVSRDDLAILAMAYFDRGDLLRRSIHVDRNSIRAHGECRVPTRLLATNHRRRTHTEALVLDLVFDPRVPDERFNRVTLDAERPLAAP